MKRQFFACILAVALALSGCAGPQAEPKQYQATFLTLFDTVTTIVGRAESEEAFSQSAQAVHDTLLEYHQLFDIYQDYAGIANLKTVNDNAGIAPVKVDERIIALLLDCKTYYTLTNGRVNVAMGSVLALWHQARTEALDNPAQASLPDGEALARAAAHTGWDTIVIDEAEQTVFITDPEQRLDVGAVAKGWATQRAAEATPEGLLISVGGNVCATGPKTETGGAWVVGISDPQGGEGYLHTLNITGGSVVTSGDYQRFFVLEGTRYDHIIDPDTLYPSTGWTSVTILCPDSGLADALSTALFLLPREAGQELLVRCQAEAMWVDREGNRFYSPGFEAFIRT